MTYHVNLHQRICVLYSFPMMNSPSHLLDQILRPNNKGVAHSRSNYMHLAQSGFLAELITSLLLFCKLYYFCKSNVQRILRTPWICPLLGTEAYWGLHLCYDLYTLSYILSFYRRNKKHMSHIAHLNNMYNCFVEMFKHETF